MLTIFIELISKTYFANACSVTYFLFIFLSLFCLIFPFLAAFASEKFWIRDEFVYDTPYFKYNNELELFVLKDNTTYFYSTIEYLNELFPRKLTTPSITYTTLDSNYDSLVEQLNVKIIIPKDDDIDVQGFKLALFFDYGFSVRYII